MAKTFKNHWFTDEPLMCDWKGTKAVGWDMAMNRLLLMSPQLRVLQSLVPRVNHHGTIGTHVTANFQERSFNNITLEKFDTPALKKLVAVNPATEPEKIPSAQARFYIDLCQHLWTNQVFAVELLQRSTDFAGKKARKFRFFKREFLVI